MLTNRAFLSGLRHRHHARSYGGKFYACRCQAVPQRRFQTSRGKGVCAQVHHQECHFRGCHPSCNDKAGSHSEAGCSQAGRHGEAGRGEAGDHQCPAAAAAPAVSTCLTKEYLDNGAMKFRDNCTGEWAQTPVTSG